MSSTNTPTDRFKRLEKYRKEKTAAVKARQVRVDNWIQNERLYNGQPTLTLLTRSNLHVPKVFEAVQTTSSKIGQMPTVEYDTKPEGDENASELQEALWNEDVKASLGEDLWSNSKIEAGLYGRAVYKLVPSNGGNKIDVVDTLSYLINPTARSTRDALYQGQQFIYRTIDQLEEEAELFGYDKDELQKLKDAKAATETDINASQERSIKDLRLSYMGYANVTQLGEKMVELTEWYTIIDKVPHVQTVANDVYELRCLPLKEVGLPRAPFVSWAVYPRAVAFWTPSTADIVRDPNLAIDVATNQLIDNNTYRNFGMMFVSSASGLKQSSIVPRPLGITSVAVGDKSIKDTVWQFTPPEIASADRTILMLNSMADMAIGISGAPLGSKGKISVTQQAAMAALVESKTNLIKQNAVRAWGELAQLHADTIKMNLTKPRKVKVYGNKHLTVEGVTRKNFKDVELIATAKSPENSQENKAIKQKAKATLYEMFKDDPKIPGQRFLREDVSKEFGMTPTDIDKLFTEEKPPQIDMPAAPGAQPQPQQPQPLPTNPDHTPVSDNATHSAAVVPPAIR